MSARRARRAKPRGDAPSPTAHPEQLVVDALRRILLAADHRIKEAVKWNAPSFHTAEHFATFHLRAKDKVQLILHLGAKPRPDATVRDDVAGSPVPLEWKGHDRAVVTFHDLAEVRRHEAAFTRLIRQWIEHAR